MKNKRGLVLRSSKSEGGYTLIELIVVVVIMAILGAAVFIRFGGDATIVNNAAERIATDIRYMRSMAISKSTPHGVHFTHESDRVQFTKYSPYWRNWEGTPEAYVDPVHVKEVNLQGDLRGVEGFVPYVYTPFGPAMVNDIIFHYDGKPYLDWATEDPLMGTLKIIVVKGDKQKWVIILPNTGEVKVSEPE